jgi:hypothetical protein
MAWSTVELFYKVPVAEVDDANEFRAGREPVTGLLPPAGNDGTPADEDQVAAVRAAVRRLVALDVGFGGDRTSILAARTLRAAEAMLTPGACEPKVECDLRAAVAELAELTGWLLCDANRHAASLARNRQALRLARSVGDRSMGLFVIHNLSLQATYLRRPERSLALVRPILDQGGLTPRLDAMFHMRMARAYAQMGLRSMALTAMDTETGSSTSAFSSTRRSRWARGVTAWRPRNVWCLPSGRSGPRGLSHASWRPSRARVVPYGPRSWMTRKPRSRMPWGAGAHNDAEVAGRVAGVSRRGDGPAGRSCPVGEACRR